MTSGPGGTPPTPGGPTLPVSATVTVTLEGATRGAREEFSTAVQGFANFLASECQRQELSIRPEGIAQLELTANSVVRAKQVYERFGTRPKRRGLDIACLIGSPVFGITTGVLGSYLNGAPATIIIAFIVSVFLTLFCVGWLASRRLL